MPQDNVTRTAGDTEQDAPKGVPLHAAGRGFSYMGTLEDTISPINPLGYDSVITSTEPHESNKQHPVRELTPG